MIEQNRMSSRRFFRLATLYTILILVAIVMLLPLFWLLMTSVKTNAEYLSYPIKILPAVTRWNNYVEALTRFDYLRYAGQTLFLALIFTILTILTSSMTGFAFARIEAPGRGILFSIVVALIIIPVIVTVIPQFIMFSRLRLTNTYWPWVLWGLAASPLYIFLFRQFFAGIPKELEDAAEVDGCTPLRTFLQIFLPNAKPAIAIAFIFNFGAVWGDWFTPVIYLNDAKTTLAVKLATAYGNPQGFPEIPITLAGTVVYMLPVAIMFFLGQKYIMEGAITSGLKGT